MYNPCTLHTLHIATCSACIHRIICKLLVCYLNRSAAYSGSFLQVLCCFHGCRMFLMKHVLLRLDPSTSHRHFKKLTMPHLAAELKPTIGPRSPPMDNLNTTRKRAGPLLCHTSCILPLLSLPPCVFPTRQSRACELLAFDRENRNSRSTCDRCVGHLCEWSR